MDKNTLYFGSTNLTINVVSVTPRITIEGKPYTFKFGGTPVCKNIKLHIHNEYFTDYSLQFHHSMSGEKYYELVIFFKRVTVVIYSEDEGDLLKIIDEYFKK